LSAIDQHIAGLASRLFTHALAPRMIICGRRLAALSTFGLFVSGNGRIVGLGLAFFVKDRRCTANNKKITSDGNATGDT
jgi:hypothetical protein